MRRALLLSTLLAFAITVNAADSPPVLVTSLHRIETADYRINAHLARVDASGARTNLALVIKAHWFPDGLRIFLEIDSPASSRAHVLLEVRPGGEASIRIAHPGDTAPAALPFDRWNDGPLGPAFSYEDFLESQYFWPVQKVVQEGILYGARKCDILKSIPGINDRTHYADVTTWLDQGIGFPVLAKKTLKGSGKVKEFTYFGLRHDQGVWSASQVEVKTAGEPGSTLLIIDRGSAHAKLTAADFSAAQLTRF